MQKHTFAATLPVFDDRTSLKTVLDDPIAAAHGAVVTSGDKGYRVHSFDELRTTHARKGAPKTFAELRTGGRELEPSSVEQAKQAGMALKIPDANDHAAALRAFKNNLGIELSSGGIGRRMALIFTHGIGNYVVVGATYECNKFHEEYGEADYQANGGDCPVHENAKLVKKV